MRNHQILLLFFVSGCILPASTALAVSFPDIDQFTCCEDRGSDSEKAQFEGDVSLPDLEMALPHLVALNVVSATAWLPHRVDYLTFSGSSPPKFS